MSCQRAFCNLDWLVTCEQVTATAWTWPTIVFHFDSIIRCPWCEPRSQPVIGHESDRNGWNAWSQSYWSTPSLIKRFPYWADKTIAIKLYPTQPYVTMIFWDLWLRILGFGTLAWDRWLGSWVWHLWPLWLGVSPWNLWDRRLRNFASGYVALDLGPGVFGLGSCLGAFAWDLGPWILDLPPAGFVGPVYVRSCVRAL